MPLICFEQKKISSEVFFLLLSILLPTLLSVGYFWSVQSNLIVSFNHEFVYFSAFLLIALIYNSKLYLDGSFFIFIVLCAFDFLNKRESSDYYYSVFVFFLAYFCFQFGKNYRCSALNESTPIINIFSSSILIAAIITSTIIFFQLISAPDSGFNYIWTLPSQSDRYSGNLSQPNHASTLFCIAIYLCIFNIIKKRKLFYLIFIIYISSALYFTQSRTGFLIISFLPLFLWGIGFRKKYDLLFSLIPFFLNFKIIPLLLDIFNSNQLLSVSRGFSSGRILIYQVAIDLIKESPYYGYGFNNGIELFTSVLERYPQYTEMAVISSFHNIFLDMILAFGVPLVLFFFLYIINKTIKIRHCILVNKDRLLAMFFLIPLIIHSFFEYPLGYSYFFIPFFFMIGVFFSENHSINGNEYFYKIYFSIMAFILSAYAFYIFDNYKNIEINFRKIELQNNGVFLPNPYKWNDSCMHTLQKYCDFLNLHTIDKNYILQKNKYDSIILKTYKKMPTPRTISLAIFVNKKLNNQEEVSRLLIIYEILFGKEKFIFLLNELNQEI